jgi:hypothetical protein
MTCRRALLVLALAAFSCKDGALTTGRDAATDAGECRGAGRYESGKEGSYRPCCPGFTEVFYLQPAYQGPDLVPVCTQPLLRIYACVRGSCGDGICEEGEAPACGCVADCPQARFGVDASAGD